MISLRNSVSEKRMKSCIMKIIDNVFEKNDEAGLLPLTAQNITLLQRFFQPVTPPKFIRQGQVTGPQSVWR